MATEDITWKGIDAPFELPQVDILHDRNVVNIPKLKCMKYTIEDDVLAYASCVFARILPNNAYAMHRIDDNTTDIYTVLTDQEARAIDGLFEEWWGRKSEVIDEIVEKGE